MSRALRGLVLIFAVPVRMAMPVSMSTSSVAVMMAFVLVVLVVLGVVWFTLFFFQKKAWVCVRFPAVVDTAQRHVQACVALPERQFVHRGLGPDVKRFTIPEHALPDEVADLIDGQAVERA